MEESTVHHKSILATVAKGLLLALQERKKWNSPYSNVQKEDRVLLKEDPMARNQWRTAEIEKAYPDKDGLVR